MTENEIVRIEDKSLDNAISAYKTTIKVFEKSKDSDYCTTLDKVTVALLEELKQYRAIGTIEEIKDLKEKNNKDFELLLKSVKESYPMFKGAYVELDVFMGDVMRRFTRERK